jgi:hypothetical protein
MIIQDLMRHNPQKGGVRGERREEDSLSGKDEGELLYLYSASKQVYVHLVLVAGGGMKLFSLRIGSACQKDIPSTRCSVFTLW